MSFTAVLMSGELQAHWSSQTKPWGQQTGMAAILTIYLAYLGASRRISDRGNSCHISSRGSIWNARASPCFIFPPFTVAPADKLPEQILTVNNHFKSSATIRRAAVCQSDPVLTQTSQQINDTDNTELNKVRPGETSIRLWKWSWSSSHWS